MSTTFINLMIIIIAIAIIGFIGLEILNFVNEAAEISSGTSDQY